MWEFQQKKSAGASNNDEYFLFAAIMPPSLFEFAISRV